MQKNQKQCGEKWKLEGRKNRNQDNFSCQNSKLKIKNVAHNDENNIFLELEYGSFEIHFSLCTATENDTCNTGQTFMKRYVVGTNKVIQLIF